MAAADYERWELNLDAWTAYPSFTYSNELNNYCANQTPPDRGIVFSFATAEQVSVVHESRLAFVGGPLAAFLTREQTDNFIALSDQDVPRTFGVIRDFLYGKELLLVKYTLEETINVVLAAHRWRLRPLFDVFCRFIYEADLLDSASDVVAAADIIVLSNVPAEFKDYFWKRVAVLYDDFSPEHVSEDTSVNDAESASAVTPSADENVSEDHSTGLEQAESIPGDPGATANNGQGSTPAGVADVKSADSDASWAGLPGMLSPLFPKLWELALSQGVVHQLMADILANSFNDWNRDFIHLALRYFEPRISDGNAVFRLLELLGPDWLREGCLLSCEEMKGCSGRAVRLLSRTLLAPSRPRQQMQSSWQVPYGVKKMVSQVLLFGEHTALKPDMDYGAGLAYTTEAGTVSTSLAKQSVQFAVQIALHSDGYLDVTINWIVGPRFPHREADMEVSLGLLDMPCLCREWEEAEVPAEERVLDSWEFTCNLAEKSPTRHAQLSLGPFPESSGRYPRLNNFAASCTFCKALATLNIRMST